MDKRQQSGEIYYETKINNAVCPVLPGHHKVIHTAGLALTTLLGSCVAACIRDKNSTTGGMNHFLLPTGGAHGGICYSTRYGVNAMEVLINDILGNGASKSQLEIKVFGGADLIPTQGSPSIGQRNSDFVLEYLKNENLTVVASDLGGNRARRIFYFPENGNVRVRYLDEQQSAAHTQEERRLERVVHSGISRSNQVELF